MIVVDASVVMKWIALDEQDRSIARVIYQRHINATEEITIPYLLYYEIANVLATKSSTQSQDIEQALNVLFKANLTIYRESEQELLESTLLAKKYKTSVYDMLYAVIAKNKKITLVTADQKFIAKTKFPFVKHLSAM